MRDKMLRLANQDQSLDEADYEALAALPKIIAPPLYCDLRVLPDKPHVRTLGHAVVREAGIARRPEANGDDDQEEVPVELNGDLDDGAMQDDMDDDYVENEEAGSATAPEDLEDVE